MYTYEYFDEIITVLMTITGLAVLLCIVALLKEFLESLLPDKFCEDNSELASIALVGGVAFVLVTKDYYVIYAKNGDGSMSPSKISFSSEVRIKEEDNIADSGVWNEHYTMKDYTSTVGRFIFWPCNNKKNVRHEIIVPTGTVKYVFEVH